MLVIGLCGGSGSGKGEACKLFSRYGIPSLDTDKIYRDLISERGECLEELVLAFGKDILLDDGSLDRIKLSSIVFAAKNAKENKSLLEKITHKHILNKVRLRLKELASNERPSAVLVDAPLLYESGFDKECNLVIAVICDKETRIRRIIERDGISRERAEQRINNQIPDCELIRRADFIIDNNDNCKLASQVEKIAENLLRRR